MSDKNKIKVEGKIKRVSVPKKPPKVEESKKTYNRKKEKKKIEKQIEANLKLANKKS